jgi:pimeloyl-ACP methyl ester carboxylesterase
MAAFFFPADRQARLRRLVGPLLGRLFAHEQVASGDLRVEAAAETAFDAREVLPRIRVPVLLVCAERDRFFPKELVDETTALIPGCTVVRYPGMGHARAAMSGRLPRDILDFVHRTRSGGAATGPAHSAG